MTTKNLFVNFENGENILVHTYDLSESEVKRFAELVTGERVLEVYHIPQEDLQYYCIDDRVYIDTPNKVENVRKKLIY